MSAQPEGAARRAPGHAAHVLSAAARAVGAVLAAGASAEVALAVPMEEALRAPVRAVTLGAVRWYLRLAPAVLPLLSRPDQSTDPLLCALLVSAVHQLEYSSHAAATTVAAAVDAARLLGLGKAAGLVNAVLRRYLRERPQRLVEVDRDLARRTAHPDWLVGALRAAWPAELEQILAANNAHPSLCLRVDLNRSTRAAYLQELDAAGLTGTAIDGIATAVTLAAPVPVAQIPGFEAGRVSVQDSSAQLAPILLAPRAHERVLDACAAPGGKSGALLELAGGELALTALDSDAGRLRRVADNLRRLGREARLVHADLRAAPQWWDGQAFDAILLDAPCSGTGVICRHPDIKLLRRASDTAAFAATQLALLEACWPLLRPGGRLLYATCSVLPAENEAVIGAFLTARPGAWELELAVAAKLGPPLRRCPQGWQWLPGAGGDGFYYACLTR